MDAIIGVRLRGGEEVIGKIVPVPAFNDGIPMPDGRVMIPPAYMLALDKPRRLQQLVMNTGAMRHILVPLMVSNQETPLYLKPEDIVSIPWTPDTETVNAYIKDTCGIEVAQDTPPTTPQVRHHRFQ